MSNSTGGYKLYIALAGFIELMLTFYGKDSNMPNCKKLWQHYKWDIMAGIYGVALLIHATYKLIEEGLL